MKLNYLQGQLGCCPLCGGNKFTKLKKNDRYGMGVITVGCDQCGLIQTNPRPTNEQLLKFYQYDYRRFYQHTVKPSDAYIQNNNKHIRMDYTVKYILEIIKGRPIRRILDIGCSEGAFFNALIKAGYDGELYGVEPNQEFGNFAEAKTGAKICKSIDQVTGEYDLIVLSHALEHFLRPDEFLKNIKTKLEMNGVLYIDVPDADEYASLADLHIAHMYHFTVRTLSELVKKSGYSVLEFEKHSPPYHPRSVRTVVIKNDEAWGGVIATSKQTETVAWEAVRKIPVFGYLIRKKFAHFGFLRSAYRFFARMPFSVPKL